MKGDEHGKASILTANESSKSNPKVLPVMLPGIGIRG